MSPRRKLSDARRRQILKAAVQVIAEKGLCDTGIKDVADQAGTSPALVIYYFGKKDILLAEALSFADEKFYAQTAEAVAEMASARDRLVELVRCSCSVGEAEDDFDEWVLWLDLWARAPRDPDVARDRQALDRRWRVTIAEIVREGQAAGEFVRVDAGRLRPAAGRPDRRAGHPGRAQGPGGRPRAHVRPVHGHLLQGARLLLDPRGARPPGPAPAPRRLRLTRAAPAGRRPAGARRSPCPAAR